MSDSWISWNPRIEEPSKPNPSTKASSVSSWAGTEKCCIRPGRSQKRMSTISTPSSFISLNDLSRSAVLHDLLLGRATPGATVERVRSSDSLAPASFPDRCSIMNAV